ncbi:MAG: ATP-binding protein [Lentisphaerae bacterium]|nr:ATP-binding protein [Lentisphaerota bacterium]
MFVYYKVGNVLSFDEPVVLSMIEQRKTKRHEEHVIEGAGVRCLRGGVVYGANASGKSNLIKSMHFLLDAVCANDCACLKGLQFAMRGKILPVMTWEVAFTAIDELFVYSIDTDGQSVLKEALYRISTNKEMVFERTRESGFQLGETLSADPWFDKKIKSSSFYIRKVDEDGLFERKDETPASRLMKSVISSLKSVEILSADSSVRVSSLIKNLKIADFKAFLKRLLRAADVGITDIKWITVPSNDRIRSFARFILPENALKRDGISFFRANGSFWAVVVSEGVAAFSELKFMHGSVPMRGMHESDGTIKLLEYSVFLYSLVHEDKFWVVDEIDRSLHPFLSRFVLDMSLRGAVGRSQLLVTTHDTTLLSQSLWRTDEVWFTEKRPDGSTDLYSLYQFKPRFDVDLAKGYLEGRWGAIPYLGKGADDVCTSKES